jgi:hypothetical protein
MLRVGLAAGPPVGAAALALPILLAGILGLFPPQPTARQAAPGRSARASSARPRGPQAGRRPPVCRILCRLDPRTPVLPVFCGVRSSPLGIRERGRACCAAAPARPQAPHGRAGPWQPCLSFWPGRRPPTSWPCSPRRSGMIAQAGGPRRQRQNPGAAAAPGFFRAPASGGSVDESQGTARGGRGKRQGVQGVARASVADPGAGGGAAINESLWVAIVSKRFSCGPPVAALERVERRRFFMAVPRRLSSWIRKAGNGACLEGGWGRESTRLVAEAFRPTRQFDLAHAYAPVPETAAGRTAFSWQFQRRIIGLISEAARGDCLRRRAVGQFLLCAAGLSSGEWGWESTHLGRWRPSAPLVHWAVTAPGVDSRQLANGSQRLRLNGRTPATVWQERTPCRPGARAGFELTVQRRRYDAYRE